MVTRPFSGSSNSGHMMTGNVGGKELNHGERNTKKSSMWEPGIKRNGSVEPLIMDTQDKGHLSTKDISSIQC